MGIQINGNNDNISAVDGDLSITGITTFSQFDVGSNIKLGNAGVITATSFVGSGANLTGLTVPGGGTGLDLNDNVKIRLGTGNDCELYHNGTDNFIDATAGNLYLRGPADASKWIILQAHSGENSVVAKPDAAVELYFNGTKKIETYASGVFVPDSANIAAGAAQDLKLRHDGSHSYIQNDTGDLQLQAKAGYNCLKLVTSGSGGNVEMYNDNSKKFETTSYGALVTGTISAGSGNFDVTDNGKFKAGNSSDLQIYHDGSKSHLKNSTGAIEYSSVDHKFFNAANNSEYARIDANGIKFNGDTAAANALNDYEEGTFTPNISYSTLQNNPTHSRQDGQYTKIGNVVHIQIKLELTNKGSGSGNVKVNGLPFGVDASPCANQQITGKPIIGVDLGGDRELFCQFEGGTGSTSLFLYSFGIESSANYSAVTSSNISNGLNIQFFGSYFTNS